MQITNKEVDLGPNRRTSGIQEDQRVKREYLKTKGVTDIISQKGHLRLESRAPQGRHLFARDKKFPMCFGSLKRLHQPKSKQS